MRGACAATNGSDRSRSANLLAGWRTLLLGVGGLGLALMLVLVLDGLWESVKARSTRIPTAGADLQQWIASSAQVLAFWVWPFS